jgi:hypothetical protein
MQSFGKKQARRSPLKASPLRQAGQSVERERLNLAFDRIMAPFLVASFLVLIAALDWIRELTNTGPSPWPWTAMAVIASALAAVRIVRARKQAVHLRQGRDGEIAVGQFLERLREGGAQVFHDICGPGFNVDHLVIAEQGIYVIETKTYSKPAGRKACIDFDGQTLLMDGQPFISDPTAQACAAAAWIRRLIRELTGRDFRPRAVVAFPGWFIEPEAQKRAMASKNPAWILEPKALPHWIARREAVIKQSDVRLISFNLSQAIRKAGSGHIVSEAI